GQRRCRRGRVSQQWCTYGAACVSRTRGVRSRHELEAGRTMAATRDFSALVRVVDEHEHQRLTRHLAEGLIEHLDPADLAKALRQANTRVRRDLLQHAGLPYRQPPPPTLCRQLIDKVKAPEACPTLHPMLRRAIGSAYERRLHKLV